MTDNEIKAANAFIIHGTDGGSITPVNIFAMQITESWDMEDIIHAAEFLVKHDFHKLVATDYNNIHHYRLLDKGLEYQQKEKDIREFIKKEAEREAKELAKEERDEHYKNLQVKDLEEKLGVMNVKQRDAWAAQEIRNKQLTLIAIISAIFSFVAMMKSCNIN
jgi:hypothetical protein